MSDLPKTILLPLLADGEFRSGQDLADALGVSRTAVWKQLNKLASLGLQIESVRGLGYRIPGGIDLLDEEVVRRGLGPKVGPLLSALHILPSVDSTNAEAMRRLLEGEGAGSVYVAEQQTAGRGRRGRTWASPFARNLYFSLVWEFSQGAAALEGLSLAVGVAVARALRACELPGVQLKWPNDILYQGAKLGGVLLEMTGDATGRCETVVGVGLNVNMPAAAAADIDQAWTDVAAMADGEPPARNTLLTALLDELLPLVAGFEAQGFAPWRAGWLERDAHANQSVILNTGGATQAGVARGVDERGALLLETTTGTRAIYGGEISLRPAG